MYEGFVQEKVPSKLEDFKGMNKETIHMLNCQSPGDERIGVRVDYIIQEDMWIAGVYVLHVVDRACEKFSGETEARGYAGSLKTALQSAGIRSI